MEHNREAQPLSVPIPRSAGFSSVQSRVIAREDGLRRLRRMSNWTAAALIVGVAAATGYFAHTNPVAPVTRTITTAVPACTGPGIGPSPRPTVSNAVATSGGSGVTVGTSSSGGGVGATGSGGTCVTPGSTGSGGGGSTTPWRDD